MNASQWVDEVAKAYKHNGATLSEDFKNFLLTSQKTAREYSEKELAIIDAEPPDAHDYFFTYFIDKAARGEPFGRVERVKQKFGQSVEENYGLSSGPFINMAKTYWTFKVEMGDLHSDSPMMHVIELVRPLEKKVASIFFPTPGPRKVSVRKREKTQRYLLKEFASDDFDVETFIAQSPILQAESYHPVRNLVFGFGAVLIVGVLLLMILR